MQVKGTSVVATLDYVVSKFGEEGLQRWLNNLGDEAREVYQGKIMPVGWYPLRSTYNEATEAICKTFFHGDARKATEVGAYSADSALRGVYRIFVRFGSPHYLIERTSRIFGSYYQGAELKVENEGDKEVTAALVRFPYINQAVEWRLYGYFKRAMEISGCKGLRINISAAKTQGAPSTLYQVKWS